MIALFPIRVSRAKLSSRTYAALAALLLGSSSLAQTPINLSGVWKREDGGIIRVTQSAQSVKMVHLEVVPMIHKEFGFNPGDEHAVGTLAGRALNGQMHVRLPVAWKTICPDQWDHWTGLELTLSEDGNTLTGRWEKSHYNSPGCGLIRKEWLPRQYTRVREVGTAASGRLRVLAVGKPLAVASFELILDASGSMWGTVGGRPKIEVAKETMRHVIEGLPDDVHAALRVYGHRTAAGKPGACEDSELVFPLAKIDKRRFLERIRGLRALGTTPIATSLDQVADDLAGSPGEKMVVLVTDGKEECGGNPSRAVSRLIKKGLKVQVNIVGFALEEESAKSEMRRAAELSGGRFFDAGSASALRDSIERVLSVPYQIRNSAGRNVAEGSVGKGAVEIPEGTYAVVVNVAGKTITTPDVRIMAGKITTVEMEQQGQQLTTRVLAP